MNLSCAFTGHRDLPCDFDYNKLENAVLKLMREGVKTFYCGLARGYDLIAAVYVINHKKAYGARLIGCIPCRTQSEYFSENDKERYDYVLGECDETVCLSEAYYVGCMQARDRYMVDRADVVLTFLEKSSGGTFYTVNYALKNGRKVINLSENQ